MRSYKQWSGEERLASLKKTKAAISRGEIPPATKCQRCNQTKGIIQYHNHDYSDPIKYLEPLCWRCHMMLHSEHRWPDAVKRYFEEVASGKQYPPVYRRDSKKLDEPPCR
jgi:hypothetical protein